MHTASQKPEESPSQDDELQNPERSLSQSAESETVSEDSQDMTETQKDTLQDTAEATAKTKFSKRAKIILATIAGALLVVYLVGVGYFSGHFFPNTAFGNDDASLKSTDEFSDEIITWVNDYTLSIEGEGFSCVLDSDQANLEIDNHQVAKNSCANQNIWAWPVEIFLPHDVSETIEASFKTDNAHRIVEVAVDKFNEEATPSQDATIIYSKDSDTCIIEPEIYGQQINKEALFTEVDYCLAKLKPTCSVTEDQLIKPNVLSSDTRLASALDKANSMLASTLGFTLNKTVNAGSLSKEEVTRWIGLDEDLTVTLDEEAIADWAQEKASDCNTYRTERTWTRADGKRCSASGGTYGWIVDADSLASNISTQLNESNFTPIDIPCTQTADEYNGKGKRDWGAYVDIDLSEQIVRYYNSSDELVYSAHCITGKPNGHSTPTGVYKLNSNNGKATLVGKPDETGEPSYRTKVAYWMPFIGGSIGLHDATWQSWDSWSSTKYMTSGSHGCINLSLSDAQWFHDNLTTGVCVITHK